MTVHGLSFDVENWYDGNLHNGPYLGPTDQRVRAETLHLLDVLQSLGVKATFFTLGKVARQYPELIRAIAAGGHEVACHGWDHSLVWRREPAALYQDLARARGVLQDLSGQAVAGFRAASWSINREALAWVPPLLMRVGFQYDSSVFPAWTPLYGIAGAPRSPWWHDLGDGQRLAELPPAVTAGVGGHFRLPFGGGVYWRALPQRLIRRLIARAAQPLVLYLHPWELNPAGVPQGVSLGLLERLVVSHGVARCEESLRFVLRTFAVAPLREAFVQWVLPGGEACDQ